MGMIVLNEIIGNKVCTQTLDMIPMGIAILCKEGKYLYVNPVAIADQSKRKFIVGRDDFEYAQEYGGDEELLLRRKKYFKFAIAARQEVVFDDYIGTANQPMVLKRRYVPIYLNNEFSHMFSLSEDNTKNYYNAKLRTELLNNIATKYSITQDTISFFAHEIRGTAVSLYSIGQLIDESVDESEKNTLLSYLPSRAEALLNYTDAAIKMLQNYGRIPLNGFFNVNSAISNAFVMLKSQLLANQIEWLSRLDNSEKLTGSTVLFECLFIEIINTLMEVKEPTQRLSLFIDFKNDGDFRGVILTLSPIVLVNQNGIEHFHLWSTLMDQKLNQNIILTYLKDKIKCNIQITTENYDEIYIHIDIKKHMKHD